MVRVSSPAKLRPWSELTAQNGDGGGSCVGDNSLTQNIFHAKFEAILGLITKFDSPRIF